MIHQRYLFFNGLVTFKNIYSLATSFKPVEEIRLLLKNPAIQQGLISRAVISFIVSDRMSLMLYDRSMREAIMDIKYMKEYIVKMEARRSH